MEKDLLPLIEILNQRWDDSRQGATNLFLIEGSINTSLDLETFLLKTLRTPPAKEYILVHDFSFSSLWGPFDPFLSWIRDFFQDPKSFDKFLNECNIYKPHQELLSSYQGLGKARRKEEILAEEFSYEKRVFQEGLLRMLRRLIENTGPLLIILRNLPLCGSTLLEFLKMLTQGTMDLPLLILGLSDPTRLSGINLELEELVQKLKNRNKWFLLRENQNPPQNSGVSVIIEDPVLPNLREVQNLLNLFCVPEALFEARRMLKLSRNENLMDQETRFSLLMVLSEAQGYLGDWDNSILNLQILHQEAQIAKRQDFLYHANRLLAVMYFKKDEIASGMRHSQQTLHLAQDLESPSFLAGAYQLIFFAKEDIAEIFFEYKDLYLNYFAKLVGLLEQLDWKNSLSYLYTRAIYLILFIWDHTSNEPLEVCQKGLELAQEMGNQFRLGVAWHSMGMIYQDRGQMEEARNAYIKSLSLRKDLQSPLERSRILNGMGYFYLNLGNYEKGWKSYKKALALLKNTHEYEEICATLFNLGALSFFAHDFKTALYYLKKATRIMNVLKIESLPYSHRADFYSLMGMALLKLEKPSQAYGYLQRIETLEAVRKKLLDFEYYNLFRGMLHRSKEALGTATRELQDLLQRTETARGKFRLLRAEAWNELLQCQEGAKDTLSELLEKAKGEFKDSEGLLTIKKWFSEYDAKTKGSFEGLHFKKIKIRTDWVITMAQKDLNLNILHKKLREIQFLNNLQQTLLDLVTQSELIQSVMEAIQESYPTEFLYLFLLDPEPNASQSFPWVLRFKTQKSPEHDPDPHLFIQSQLDKGMMEETLFGSATQPPQGVFLPLIEGGTAKGFLVLGNSQGELNFTEDDLRTLTLASRQFLIAWELKETQEQLLKAATIDPLTGVFNRGEFQKRFELEIKRAQRLSSKGEVSLSLLFMDLDNFKFCNDSYGHDAGDIILKETGELLKQSCREVDIIGRFGGDEFVIFLPDTGAAGSQVLAERITSGYSSPGAPGSRFVPDDGPGVTCSLGIVTIEGALTESASELLIKADKALYEAKYSGKNTWKRWIPE